MKFKRVSLHRWIWEVGWKIFYYNFQGQKVDIFVGYDKEPIISIQLLSLNMVWYRILLTYEAAAMPWKH